MFWVCQYYKPSLKKIKPWYMKQIISCVCGRATKQRQVWCRTWWARVRCALHNDPREWFVEWPSFKSKTWLAWCWALSTAKTRYFGELSHLTISSHVLHAFWVFRAFSGSDTLTRICFYFFCELKTRHANKKINRVFSKTCWILFTIMSLTTPLKPLHIKSN